MSENQFQTSADEATAEKLYRIFSCNPRHIEMTNDPKNKYYTYPSPITLDLVKEHLIEVKTIGTCANNKGFANWSCIEVDEQGMSVVLPSIKEEFNKFEIPDEYLLIEKDIFDRGKIYTCFDSPVNVKAIEFFLLNIRSTFSTNRPLELYSANQRFVRLPGGWHQIKKIPVEFYKPNIGFTLPQYLKDEAIKNWQPINSAKFLYTVTKLGWKEETVDNKEFVKKITKIVDDKEGQEKITDIKIFVKKISLDQIETLLNKLKIKKDDHSDKYYCPFHKDGNVPNLTFDKNNNRFKCFSQGCSFEKGGDIVEVIKRKLNISPSKAIDWICDCLKIIRPQFGFPQFNETIDQKITNHKHVSMFLKSAAIRVIKYLYEVNEAFNSSDAFISIKQISESLKIGTNSASYSLYKLEYLELCQRIEPTEEECKKFINKYPAFRYKIRKIEKIDKLLTKCDDQLIEFKRNNIKLNKSIIIKNVKDRRINKSLNLLKEFGKTNKEICEKDVIKLLNCGHLCAKNIIKIAINNNILSGPFNISHNKFIWKFNVNNN